MPASPLAAALIGQETPGNGFVDPAILEAQPQLTLAKALMGNSISTAPASPWEALARVGQAAAGLSVQNDAVSQLAKAYSNSADQMANSLEQINPNHPLIKALRSPDLATRMAAAKEYGKALTLMSEGYSLSPGQQRQINGTMVGQSTAPQSETGKTAADIARNPSAAAVAAGAAGQKAGAEASARAPYEAGGEVVKGNQTFPITAATRTAIQPQIIGGGPGPGAGAEGPGAPKDQSRAPSGLPVGGKPLANPAIGPMAEADAKEVAGDRESAIKGQQDMATVKMIQDFLPKVQTGWGAETKLEGARILKALGVDQNQVNSFLKTDVTAGQLLQKKFLELSSAAARNMGAREPGSVIQMFAKAYPNLGTDPQAITLQTNALYMDRLRQQQLAQDKTNYLNDSINGVQGTGQYRGLKGFNEQFNKIHPTERYLGAAEAMSGAPEVWKRVTTVPDQNSIIRLIPPGTRYMAPDGQWHIMPGAQ